MCRFRYTRGRLKGNFIVHNFASTITFLPTSGRSISGMSHFSSMIFLHLFYFQRIYRNSTVRNLMKQTYWSSIICVTFSSGALNLFSMSLKNTARKWTTAFNENYRFFHLPMMSMNFIAKKKNKYVRSSDSNSFNKIFYGHST